MAGFHVRTSENGKVQGPFSGQQLVQLVRSTAIQPHHLVSQDGGESWHAATRFSGLDFRFHVKTSRSGRVQGPFSSQQLEQWARSSKLQAHHLISQDGGGSWHEAWRFDGLQLGSGPEESILRLKKIRLLQKARSLSDPYLDNPFRILNLSADATSREIDRAAHELQIQLRFAAAETETSERSERSASDGDEGEIKRAVQELKDPVRRLQHELFWVRLSRQEKRRWDIFRELRDFPRPEAEVAARRYEVICDESTEALRKNHNLAILYHGQAISLEREWLERVTPERIGETLDELWRKALRHWAYVFDSASFWKLVEERTGELNDPRLPTNRVRALRKRMPQLVLEPTVESARHYLLKVDSENTKRHVRFLSSSSVDQINVDEALAQFFKPLVARMDEFERTFRRQLDDLDDQAESTPEQQRGSLRQKTCRLRDSLIDEVRPIIDTIKAVGDLPGLGSNRVLDEAAILLWHVGISLRSYYEDLSGFTAAKDRALEWAVSQSVRDKIRSP